MGTPTSNQFAEADLGLTAASVLGQAFAGYRAAEINGDVARANARLAEGQARDALARGADAQLRLRREGGKLRGSQKARLAAGNVDVDQGSPLDILEETDRGIEADAAVIRGNAGREAHARRVEASGYRAQARGSNPGLVAGLTLLTGAGRVAEKWYRLGDSYDALNTSDDYL